MREVGPVLTDSLSPHLMFLFPPPTLSSLSSHLLSLLSFPYSPPLSILVAPCLIPPHGCDLHPLGKEGTRCLFQRNDSCCLIKLGEGEACCVCVSGDGRHQLRLQRLTRCQADDSDQSNKQCEVPLITAVRIALNRSSPSKSWSCLLLSSASSGEMKWKSGEHEGGRVHRCERDFEFAKQRSG